MSLLDLAKDVAKSTSEKASDTIEITKLKGKISGENKAIAEAIAQIGQLVYDKLTEEGVEIPEEVKAFRPEGIDELIAAIQSHKDAIQNLEKEIENVKND